MGLWISSKQNPGAVQQLSFGDTSLTDTSSESVVGNVASMILTLLAVLLIAGSVVLYSFADMQTAARHAWKETEAEVYRVQEVYGTVSSADCHYTVEDQEYNATISPIPEYTIVGRKLPIYYHSRIPSRYQWELPEDGSSSMISGMFICIFGALVCIYLSYRIRRGSRSSSALSSGSILPQQTKESRIIKTYDGTPSDNSDNY